MTPAPTSDAHGVAAPPIAQRSASPRALRWLARGLSGAAFPAFTISALVFGALLSTAVLVVPLEGTPMEAFAREFKVWCFGYDPEQGTLIWAMVASFTTAPFLLATFVLLAFSEPLRGALRTGVRGLWRPICSAALLLAALTLSLYWVNPSSAEASTLPFPGQALRTSFSAPAFTLSDHAGHPLSLSELRGRVVLVTAIYSRCGSTCPMILSDTRQALASLSDAERRDLSVLAITLDPAHDDPTLLAKVALARQMQAPLYHLLTGEPARVERTLDAFSIARKRNAETGVIEHANIFTLIDRHGRIAYRLSLGPRNRTWLADALRQLLRES